MTEHAQPDWEAIKMLQWMMERFWFWGCPKCQDHNMDEKHLKVVQCGHCKQHWKQVGHTDEYLPHSPRIEVLLD